MDLGSRWSKISSFIQILGGITIIFCFLITPCYADQAINENAGKVIFCKDVNTDFTPVEPGTVFDRKAVVWVAYFTKTCGANQILFSLYKKKGPQEMMLTRETVDVRPEWNALMGKDTVLPGSGEYMFEFTRMDGSALSKGTVTIKLKEQPKRSRPVQQTVKKEQSEKIAPMQKKAKVEGSNLDSLYEKYKTSATPAE